MDIAPYSYQQEILDKLDAERRYAATRAIWSLRQPAREKP